MKTLIRLILLILAAATDACDLHKYATASTRAVRNEVQDKSGKSVQSVPSVLLSPEGGNRPSANSHTAMGTRIRLILLIMLISEAATAACTGTRPQARTPSENAVKDRSEKSVQSVLRSPKGRKTPRILSAEEQQKHRPYPNYRVMQYTNGSSRRGNIHQSAYLVSPSTIVRSTRACKISSSVQVSRSWESTTISAALPTSNEPLKSSSKPA